LKEILKKHLINFRGKKLNSKYLVLESDDWGSIRIPNIKTRNSFLEQGLINNNDPFSLYDTLETATDLDKLFDVLSQFKDLNNNSPIVTANTVVANPDFQKIKESNYKHYFFEPFTKTYSDNKGSENAFKLFNKGINERYFFPQFHCREHLNLPMWMQILQSNNTAFIKAFQYNCFSIDFKDTSNKRGNLMASYDYNSEADLEIIKQSIHEGLSLFESIFGFKSKSSIAPCYVWDKKIEQILQENEVKFLQGSRFQNSPIKGGSSFKKIFHFNGQKNEFGQYYFQRNGLFEPSLNHNVDWVDKCMESIAIAFRWNKPAIIGTHRINFCGGLEETNRDRNLILLQKLLKQIIKKWPEVQFLNSAALHELYS
jgi:hypothetical protein